MSSTDPRRLLLKEREDLYGELRNLKREVSGEHVDLLLLKESALAERMKTLLGGIVTLEKDTILEEVPPPEAHILTQRIKAYQLRVTALQEQFSGLQKEIHEALGEKPLEDPDAPSPVPSAPLPGKRPSRRFEYPEDPDLPQKDTGPDVKKKTHNEVSEVADEITTLDNPKKIRSVYGDVVYGSDKGGRPDKPNEDRVVVNTKGVPGIFDAAFAVIDGMGGHRFGSEAAYSMAKTFREELEKGNTQIEINPRDPNSPTKKDVLAMQRMAHESMRRQGIADGGALYALAVLKGETLSLYHAGDVKIVVYDKNGRVKSQTLDQNGWREFGDKDSRRMMKDNRQALVGPTNTVTGQKYGYTEITEIHIEPGDRIVLASDGLSDNFKKPEDGNYDLDDLFDADALYERIKDLSAVDAMKIINENLKYKMESGGKKDNRSVIIVDIEQIPGQAPNNPPEKEPKVEVSDADAQAVIDELMQERGKPPNVHWMMLRPPFTLNYPEIQDFSKEIISLAKDVYTNDRKRGLSHTQAIEEVNAFVERRYDVFLEKEREGVVHFFAKLRDNRVVLYDDPTLGPYTIVSIESDGRVLVQDETGSVKEKYTLDRIFVSDYIKLAKTLSVTSDRHDLAPFASDLYYTPDDRKRFARLAEDAVRHISHEIQITDNGKTVENVLIFWIVVFGKIGVRADELDLNNMEKVDLYEKALRGLLNKDEKKLLDDLKSKTEEDVANEYCDQLPSGDKEATDQFELLTKEMKRGDIDVWEDIRRVKTMDPSIGGEIDDIVYRATYVYKQAIDSKRSREEAKQAMEQEFTRLYQELVNKEIDRCYDVLEICKAYNTFIPVTNLGDIQIIHVDKSANNFTIRTENGEEKVWWLNPNRALSSLIEEQFVYFASQCRQEFVPSTARDSAQNFFFYLAERMRSHNPNAWQSTIKTYWGPLLFDIENEKERLRFTEAEYLELLYNVFGEIRSLPDADLFPADTSDDARRRHMRELLFRHIPNLNELETQAEKRKEEEEKEQQKQEKKDAKQRKKSEKQKAKQEQQDAKASVKTSADVIKERLKIRKEPGLTAHWWWVKNYIRFRLLQEKDRKETKMNMADVHEFLAEKLEKTPAYFKKQKDYKAQAEKLLDDARMAMGKKRFDALFVSSDPDDPPRFDKEAQLFWRGGIKKNGDDRITIVGVERLLDRLIVREKLKPAYMARFYEKIETLVQNGAFSFEPLDLPAYPNVSGMNDETRRLAIEEYEKVRDEKLKEFEALVQKQTSEIYREILEEERKEIAEAMFEEVRKGTKGNDVAYKKAWEHYREVQQAIVVREIELHRGVLAHLDQEFQKTQQELGAYATRKSLPIEWGKDRLRKYLFLPRLKNKTAPYPVEVIVKSLISGGGVAAGVYGADISFHALSDASRLGPGEPLYDTGRPYLETIGAVKAGRLLQDQAQKRTMVRNRFWPAFHRQAFVHRAWELIPGPLRQPVIAGIRLFTGGKSALLNFEAFRDLRHAQESIAKKHEIPMEIIERLSDNAWLLPQQMETELNTLEPDDAITADQIAQAKTHLVEAARRIKGTWNPFSDKDSSLLSKESKLKPRNILKKLTPEIETLAAALEKEILENGEREAFRVEESLRARLKKLVLEIPAEKWTSGSRAMQAYLEEKKDGTRLRPKEDTDHLERKLCYEADTIGDVFRTHVMNGVNAGKQDLYKKIDAFAEQQKQHILAKAEQKKAAAESEGENAKTEFLNRANALTDLLGRPENIDVWENAAAMHAFLDTQKTNDEIGDIVESFRDYLTQVADEDPKRNPKEILNTTENSVRAAADKVKEDTKKAAEAEAENMKNNVADAASAESATWMKRAIDAISEERWISGKESMKTYLDNLVLEKKILEEEKNIMQDTLFSLADTAAEQYASEVEKKIGEAKAAIEKDWIKMVAEKEKDKKIQEVKDEAAIQKISFEQGGNLLFTRLQDDLFAWFGKGSMEARLDECKKDDAIGSVIVDRMKPRLLDAAEKVRGSGGKPQELLKEVERRMVVAEAYQLANHHWRFRKPLFDEANYRTLQDIRKTLLLEIIPSEQLLERDVKNEETGETSKEIEISFKAVATFLETEKKKLDTLRTNISREKRNIWIKRIIALAGGGVAGYAIGAPFSAMVFGAKAAKSAAAYIPLAIRKGK